MGVTSIGGHTRPDCNARYDVRIKLVETWLFVCLTWRGNVGRLFVMVLHVVLTPMKSWTLIGREWINSARVWNTRFWLAVWWSNQYYYSLLSPIVASVFGKVRRNLCEHYREILGWSLTGQSWCSAVIWRKGSALEIQFHFIVISTSGFKNVCKKSWRWL